jgi:uroporphyrin-3 C-methyltransferase
MVHIDGTVLVSRVAELLMVAFLRSQTTIGFMSQDKTPHDNSLPDAVKAEALADGAKDAGKRKDSGITQPVDALRQSSGQTVTRDDAAGMSQTADQTQSQSQSKSQFKTTPSSTSTMNRNAQSSTSKPAGFRGIWGGILLGLVLLVVALCVGLWWQQQRFETVAREIATRLQQSDRLVAQARDNANQALSLANAQREVVDQLSRELSVTGHELKTLQQAWQSANEGLDQTLLLNDLKRLITMANQELVLFGNVSSAVSILSSVDAMLRTQSAPALKNLQQAVLTDLARLRSVPQVDVASLSARLDSLIQLTGKAPLLSPAGLTAEQNKRVVPQPPQAPDSSQPGKSPDPAAGDGQSWWQSWGAATSKVSQWTSEASSVLLREFADVMSIRKADDPQALLLSEEQAIQLRANVRAMLLSAQLALMTRQADIWRSELNEVQSLLNTRYDTEALDTKASVSLLNELLDAPVAAQVPSITDTLNALATAERALSIPVAPDEAASIQVEQDDPSDQAATSGTDTSATGQGN